MALPVYDENSKLGGRAAAAYLGISEATLYAKRRKYPELMPRVNAKYTKEQLDVWKAGDPKRNKPSYDPKVGLLKHRLRDQSNLERQKRRDRLKYESKVLTAVHADMGAYSGLRKQLLEAMQSVLNSGLVSITDADLEQGGALLVSVSLHGVVPEKSKVFPVRDEGGRALSCKAVTFGVMEAYSYEG